MLGSIAVIQPWFDGAVTGDFPAEIRAHVSGVGVEANTTEVEPVGIPAGADGGIGVMINIGMPLACFQEQGEIVIGHFKEFATKAFGEPGPTGAVAGIMVFIDPAAVVEEGEEPNDVHHGTRAGREDPSVTFDPPPVIGAMEGVMGAMAWEGTDMVPE